jgi:hypothetical protein
MNKCRIGRVCREGGRTGELGTLQHIQAHHKSDGLQCPWFKRSPRVETQGLSIPPVELKGGRRMRKDGDPLGPQVGTKGCASERQILDLAKLFLSADQINLYFIQIIDSIRQFRGIDKNLCFLLSSD